jgi:hypothetical protein
MNAAGRKTMLAGLGAALLTACNPAASSDVAAPPRATDRAPLPKDLSLIAVPVEASIAPLKGELERAVPRTLWTINKREKRCIKPQRVNMLGESFNITPPIACTIIGQVTRGRLRFRGQGRDIIIDMPITARVSARDVGGVLKGETATASAMVHARVTLDLRPDWRMSGKARLRYGWTRAPGIDFLGQRITFTEQADRALAPVVRDIEQQVAREVGRIDLRGEAAKVWQQAFTVLELNRQNPPVWMRVTPQRVLFGGYQLEGQMLSLQLGVEAIGETFVAARPEPPAPTPLPNLVAAKVAPRFDLRVPVIADYTALEPVIARALANRSARPFDVPALGPVDASFGKVTAYGTTGGRIAVGIALEAKAASRKGETTKAMVWVTAQPVNAPGSAEVRFTNVEVTGNSDGLFGDVALALARDPQFAPVIAEALTQNFARDLESLQGKIRAAVAERQEGALHIVTTVDSFETGEIKAYGTGLYLPVRMIGAAKVDVRQARAGK